MNIIAYILILITCSVLLCISMVLCLKYFNFDEKENIKDKEDFLKQHLIEKIDENISENNNNNDKNI